MSEMRAQVAGIAAVEPGRWIFSLRSIHHSKYGTCSSISNQVDPRTIPVII